ncbi:predicted protein [Sclerotinia sclerotiorum 1980 UF-70]|uniref:Uncharacterized protein n=1 Tax=Sclerotinia sclerotiorum (strain ATCC 18683 / 1980 / Ss-1) TaxID=665079 RepID=A7EMM5_SCLS1|nr:predicted protein [Sclerotinia sclerotiorum 1980 UF-70]EDO04091.1 predicted protein [Sclerotinia sclerotiorum 1980 UF-70]
MFAASIRDLEPCSNVDRQPYGVTVHQDLKSGFLEAFYEFGNLVSGSKLNRDVSVIGLMLRSVPRMENVFLVLKLLIGARRYCASRAVRIGVVTADSTVKDSEYRKNSDSNDVMIE